MVDRNERHSSSEVLRELGGIYVAARQYADARQELEPYVERRPYDPEGLWYLGQAMQGLGNTAAARELYARGSSESAITRVVSSQMRSSSFATGALVLRAGGHACGSA